MIFQSRTLLIHPDPTLGRRKSEPLSLGARQTRSLKGRRVGFFFCVSHLRIICVARNGDRCLEDLIEAAIQEEEDADSDSDLDECASPWRELRMP